MFELLTFGWLLPGMGHGHTLDSVVQEPVMSQTTHTLVHGACASVRHRLMKGVQMGSQTLI